MLPAHTPRLQQGEQVASLRGDCPSRTRSGDRKPSWGQHRLCASCSQTPLASLVPDLASQATSPSPPQQLLPTASPHPPALVTGIEGTYWATGFDGDQAKRVPFQCVCCNNRLHYLRTVGCALDRLSRRFERFGTLSAGLDSSASPADGLASAAVFG